MDVVVLFDSDESESKCYTRGVYFILAPQPSKGL